MRANDRAGQERVLRVFERSMRLAAERKVVRAEIEDARLRDDYTITLDGRRAVNFGSCAYLGLNLDPRLRAASIDAIGRYGVQYSSSRAYTSVPLYGALEDRLRRIFEAPVAVPTTTTLGHLGALPVLVEAPDLVLVDAQTHASVHLACQVLKSEQIPVVVLPHNDVDALQEELERHSEHYRRLWYLADGIYSMFGDMAPLEDLRRLLDTYPDLWAYVDDAHGVGWYGQRGRGCALEELGHHPHLVVAGSLAKSWASGGAVLVFPEEDLARRVTLTGGTFTFSGPINPPELAAAVAAADILLSPEFPERQARLTALIDLTNRLLREHELPALSTAPTPLWFVRTGGGADRATAMAARLLEEGFYLNPSAFPVVPFGSAGLRFTVTAFHTEAQIAAMIETLADLLDGTAGDNEIVIDLRESEVERLQKSITGEEPTGR